MLAKAARALGMLAYAVAVIAVFCFVAYFSFNVFVRSGVTTVPELTGIPESEVGSTLIDAGLTLRRVYDGDRYDEEIPGGRILEQSPRGGSLVKRGSAVEIVVSLGPERLLVPDLTGKTPQAAQVTLTGTGLTLGRIVNVYSQAALPGTVVEQVPSAGSRVGRGNSVALFVSVVSHADTFLMPDLAYRSLESTRHFFERRGYRLGSVKFEPYEGLSPGIILRQYPLPGHPLGRQDVISLVVTTAG